MEPNVISPRSPKRIFLIILITLAAGGISGLLIFNLGRFTSATPQPVFSPLNYTLPINPQSGAVQSAGLLYLLKGVVEEIKPASKERLSGYEILLRSPQGPNLEKRLFVSSQSATVVKLDNQNKETKYPLENIKPKDFININYYLDLKDKNKEGQVTKLIIMKQ